MFSETASTDIVDTKKETYDIQNLESVNKLYNNSDTMSWWELTKRRDALQSITNKYNTKDPHTYEDMELYDQQMLTLQKIQWLVNKNEPIELRLLRKSKKMSTTNDSNNEQEAENILEKNWFGVRYDITKWAWLLSLWNTYSSMKFDELVAYSNKLQSTYPDFTKEEAPWLVLPVQEDNNPNYYKHPKMIHKLYRKINDTIKQQEIFTKSNSN